MSDRWEIDAIKQQTEFQEQYSTWKEYPRDFTGYLKTHIGMLLFGTVEQVDPDVPLMQYHECYEEKQKSNIRTIFDKIMNLFPNSSYIQFNSTFLTLKRPRESPILYVIFLCRSPSNLNKIYFIEPHGRVYDCWSDFTDNNKLPKCEYITVQDGVYTIGKQIMKFKSPAKSKGFITETLDYAATIVTIGSMTAGVFSVAPVTAACAGICAGIYGASNSVLTIKDRIKHGESVGLNNKESVLHYANITASGLTGIGALAIANAGKISNFFGPYSKFALGTIRIVSYSTLIFDGAFFVVNAHDFWKKYKDKSISVHDVFNLSLQMFLLYGAVMNVRDVHRTLSEVQQSNLAVNNLNVSNKKLTKIQRRNLRRRRANARRRQQETGANAVQVIEYDKYTSLKKIAFHGGLFGIKFLLQQYPRAEVIFDEFNQIRNLITALLASRLSFPELAYGFSQHLGNLNIILKEDLGNLRTFLAERFPSVPNNDEVAQIMNNEMDRIEQSHEDIYAVSTENSDTATIISTGTSVANFEESNQMEFENIEQRRPSNHKIILEAAKCMILNCEILESSLAVIRSFHDALIFVINEVETFFQKYDLLLAKNTAILGEEKAKEMLLVLGTKKEYDFFPNKATFCEQVIKAADKVDVFLANNTNIKRKSDSLSTFVCEIVDNLLALVDDLFTIAIPDSNEIGLNRLVGVLKTISTMLFENLTVKITTSVQTRDCLFRENSEILGEEYTYEMLRNGGILTNELDIFKQELTQLGECKNNIVLSILENYIPNDGSNKEDGSKNRSNDEQNPAEANLSHIIFATACEKFYQKIVTQTDNEEKRGKIFKKVVRFMASKIVDELNSFKTNCEKLKENIDLVELSVFKRMLRNVAPAKSSSLMKEICEKLDKDDSLVLEFFRYYDVECDSDLMNLKVWDNTIGEEGFTAYRIECCDSNEDDLYLSLASDLFKMPFSSSVIVNRDRNFIFFNSNNVTVTFHFNSEDNTAIVILVDLNKRDDQDDTLSDEFVWL